MDLLLHHNDEELPAPPPPPAPSAPPALPLLSFPNELLLMIASDLEAHDLASLVLTRRYLHELLTPTLYSCGSRMQNSRGETPLHWTVKQNQYKSAGLLLSRGADPLAQSYRELETPLHRAVGLGYLHFVNLFLNYDGVTEVYDMDGRSPLHRAAWEGKDQIITAILSKVPQSLSKTTPVVGMSPLHYATLADNLSSVSVLTVAGIDVNAGELRGITALHIAAKCDLYSIAKHLVENGAKPDLIEASSGDTPLHIAALAPSDRIVKLLLAANPSAVFCRNATGETPLHRAIFGGFENIAKLFLDFDKSGQLPNVLCGSGQSLLTYAFCGIKPPTVSLIRLLLNYNSDVNFRSGVNGHTPLHCAASAGDSTILGLFLEKGGDVNIRDQFGSTPLHEAASYGSVLSIQLLLENGADINVTDDDGQTPLYCAVERGREVVVRLLLDLGANVNALDICGMSPLSRACAQCAMHVNPNMVNLLVERGAEVGSRDLEGMSALHHASREGHLQVVRLLLSHGARIREKDKSGETALDVAEIYSRTDVVDVLRQAMGMRRREWDW